ncbi:MAG TPA: hypothetical protein VJQ56_11440, partial [Blastocatellia bacterium]|nr:hypothetical protein [Blastocatellia bacterium]
MISKPARLLLFLLVSFLAGQFTTSFATYSAGTSSDNADKRSTLARLPLDFVENRGQWDSSAKFIASKGAVSASFEPDAIRLQLGRTRQAAINLKFEGASTEASIQGENRRAGFYNFFSGDNPQEWRSRVAAYESIIYRGLYRGIEMRVREHADRLEYDLILAAGAKLDTVVIRADGASAIEIAEDGSLILQTQSGPLRQTPPVTWEELPNGERRAVECRFRKIDDHSYGFDADRPDDNLPLVVDPGLEWATYLGGGFWDEIHDIKPAGDGTGDAILVGATLSPDFSGRSTPVAGFVVRLDSAGALVYKTILNGSERE